jgi:hypothetical protein
MFSQHPEIAKRWAKEYGSKPVPNKAGLKQLLKKRQAK